MNFAKGDLRPTRQVVRKVEYVPAQADTLKEELRTRVRMVRAGVWPMNPDPVGCGLCQTRCHAINVKEKRLLESVAIVVEAGPGKEDRMANGSYRALREKERQERANSSTPAGGAGADAYLPDFLKGP